MIQSCPVVCGIDGDHVVVAEGGVALGCEICRLRNETAHLREWLDYLVQYVRDDQCAGDCVCCKDYLRVAEHAAARASERQGLGDT